MQNEKEPFFGVEKTRIIQELVPGKQITLAHIVANPEHALYDKLQIERESARRGKAIGILSFTPAEAALIAADISVKASGAELGTVDIKSGTVILNGTFSELQSAFTAVIEYFEKTLDFSVCAVTKT